MEENKTEGGVNIMALISYIGPLCLIPIFTKEKDEFVKFHAKQGLILFIIEVIIYLIFRILPIWYYVWSIINIIYIVEIAFSIIGIVNVVNKQKKQLPLIGGLAEKIKP
jgi:uncharacterized membrane protein